MKLRISFLLALAAISCSSGDLQIETVDFESATVQNCGALSTTTELFFKLNDQEALILELESGLLANEASDGELESAIPGSSQLTYRIFDGSISSAYFCDAVPPATPVVLEEIEAEAGSVLITTVQDPDDSNRFEHEIRLSGITFVNKKGERLTNLAIEDFGTVTTTAN